jgi:DNA-binding MarR family transcriptional regulator
MDHDQALETAREILHIMPFVMRTVVAGLRSTGELPAPAHFPLLVMLKEQPRTLTELAELRGVSLPTMSNSVTALVQRGWVRRNTPKAASNDIRLTGERKKYRRNGSGTVHDGSDRRVVLVEVTVTGREMLERVEQAAERHLAGVLAPLDSASRRRLEAGFAVLRKLFDAPPAVAGERKRRARVRASQP